MHIKLQKWWEKKKDRYVSLCPFNVKYTFSTLEKDFWIESCIPYGKTNNEIACTDNKYKAQSKTLINGIYSKYPNNIAFKVEGNDEDFCTINCAE